MELICKLQPHLKGMSPHNSLVLKSLLYIGLVQRLINKLYMNVKLVISSTKFSKKFSLQEILVIKKKTLLQLKLENIKMISPNFQNCVHGNGKIILYFKDN